MASRSVWKGFIHVSLVSVPVKAYTANVSGGGGISLNQLHAECHSRIKYKKTCPQHGDIANDQIVSGYEFADGQYVIIQPEEIEKLRTPNEKAVTVSSFVKPDAIDPTYFTDRTLYLVPDGPVAQEPYALLQRVMIEDGRYALAQVAMQGKKQMVLLRPVGNLLVMSFLKYTSEVKNPMEFEDEVQKIETKPDEVKLAKTLVETLSTDEVDLEQYKDDYTEKLKQLIESKVEGKQIVEQPLEEPPQVINLMEALQKSLAQAKKASTNGKPPKLAAPGSAAKEAAARKRKTS